MRVHTNARLHEETVKGIAAGAIAPLAQPRRTTSTTRTITTRTLTVHPEIMRQARRAACGDMTRLVIINENKVLVLNQKRK